MSDPFPSEDAGILGTMVGFRKKASSAERVAFPMSKQVPVQECSPF